MPWFTNELIKKLHNAKIIKNNEVIIDKDYCIGFKTFSINEFAKLEKTLFGIARAANINCRLDRIEITKNTVLEGVVCNSFHMSSPGKNWFKLPGGQYACGKCIKILCANHGDQLPFNRKRYIAVKDEVVEFGNYEDIGAVEDLLMTDKFFISGCKISICHETLIEGDGDYLTMNGIGVFICVIRKEKCTTDNKYAIPVTRGELNLRLLQKYNTHHNFLMHQFFEVLNVPNDLIRLIIELYIFLHYY